jgi:thioredoxin-like negative regulator of GroEL
MEKIDHLDLFDSLLLRHSFVLIYFSGPNCSVCHALKPQIDALLSAFFPEIVSSEVPIDKFPELASRYTIFTVPAVLFFIDGREYIREVRMIDVSLLNQKLEKLLKLYND